MTKAAELAKMGEVLTNSQIGGRRNIVLNGSMQVAQRGDTTSVQTGYGGCDRFQFASSGATRVTLQQSTDVPSNQGFINSQRVDVTTADSSLAAGDYAQLRTKIEAQDLQHLKYGTSEAEKLTLQFWVKSSKTGTHIIELYHYDANYMSDQTYTISSANTWQKVTVTFDGYQTTNFANDNGIGLGIQWWLLAGSTYSSGTLTSNTWHNTQANRAVGQVNVMDSTDNNFYLTGVQLEVGSQATPFEHRSFGEELVLCHRYYQSVTYEGFVSISVGIVYTNGVNAVVPMRYEFGKMRSTPTITLPTAGQSSGGTISLLNSTAGYPTTTGTHSVPYANDTTYTIRAASYSGLANASGASWFYPNGDATFQYDAEL